MADPYAQVIVALEDVKPALVDENEKLGMLVLASQRTEDDFDNYSSPAFE